MSRTPDEAVSQPVKVGIVGLGRAGWGMIYKEVAERSDLAVVAGADVLAERTAELQAACGATPYSSLDGLLADPEVELVAIANASKDHAATALAALRAGKHVLAEKPVALSLAETDELIAAAEMSEGRLLVRHNRRFDPPLLMSKRIIASGKIGRVFRVQLRWTIYRRRADWQTLREHGGGLLLNWGPHIVDWAMQLVGGPATDIWSDLRRVAAAGDAEDVVKLVMRGGSGAIADLEIGTAIAVDQPGWHVVGEHGGFVIDGDEARLRYFSPDGLESVEASSAPPTREHGYGSGTLDWVEETLKLDATNNDLFWDAVVATLRGNEPFPITLEEARENMRVIEEARRGTAYELATHHA